jgi:hypothetical protein
MIADKPFQRPRIQWAILFCNPIQPTFQSRKKKAPGIYD